VLEKMCQFQIVTKAEVSYSRSIVITNWLTSGTAYV